MKICLECEGISDTQQELCASCGAHLTPTDAVHFPLRRGEEDAANPLLGTIVDGKYRVRSVLGKGGMGIVFRAIHQVSLVPVALKILNPRYSANSEYRDYFLAEAQKAGRVTHEHAGRVLDVGEAGDGTVYIAMEEVNGVTLHECIHGPTLLPPALVVEILQQICQGLAAAHDAGLVHRDLSPRNVMVVVRGDEPFVKILDFGIAKGLPLKGADGAETGGLAAPPGFANPPYSSPEHLQGRDVDARADLYSLGVIAYEALTQSLPVSGGTTREMADATVRGELTPMQSAPGVPARLTRLVRGLTARDPEARPGSAREVLATLHSVSQPESRLLRDVAVLVFFVAVVVLGFAYTGPADLPYLTHVGSELKMGAPDAVPDEQHLRSEVLSRLRFQYGGFAPRDLTVEAERDGAILFRTGSLGATDEQGDLVLDDRSSEYRDFVSQLENASDRGAVVITFRVPGRPPLGVARVRVDDSLPVLKLSHFQNRTAGGSVLNRESELAVDCEEDGPVRELVLEYRAGRGPFKRVDVGQNRRRPAHVFLVDLQEGCSLLTDVELRVHARDAAGNVGESVLKSFDLDFCVPGIKSPVDAFALFDVGGKLATLSLTLDQHEPGLQVFVRPITAGREPGEFRTVAHKLVSTELDVDLEVELGGDLGQATLEIELRDQAGNRSPSTHKVTFSTRSPKFELIGAETSRGHLVALSEMLVWNGAATEFTFECNPYYRPTMVEIRRGVAREDRVRVALIESARGGGRIRIRRSGARGVDEPDVDEDLSLVIALASSGGDAVPFPWPLRSRSTPMVLRLPATTAMRYYSELTESGGLFEGATLGDLVQSQGWKLAPNDARLLGGAVFLGTGEPDLVRHDLAPRDDEADTFFLAQRAQPGANLVALKLHDVFGRPVEVRVGPGSPRILSVGPAAGAAVIAEFEYHAKVASLSPNRLTLEYLQPTRLTLYSDYEFHEDDRDAIRLAFETLRALECVEFRSQAAGTEMVFDLPFDSMAQAVQVPKDADEFKRAGEKYRIDGLELRTPAGMVKFKDVEVETIRSSLRQLRLATKFAVPDPVLAAIEMVPVLRPLEAFADRVPLAMRERGPFLRKAQTVNVRFSQDCYLQQRELTRAQYVAIVQAFLALPAAGRPGADRVCFVADRVGQQRLSEAGMCPLGCEDGLERWRDRAPNNLVTGVNFYQAFAVVRMAGQVIAGDLDTFRLPFGVEMELAALRERPIGELNGVVGGPTLAQLEAGDTVTTNRGDIHGLDFGAREWVMDLPWPMDPAHQALVKLWLEDHEVHMRRAVRFHEMDADLKAGLQRKGVVRGVMLGETRQLWDVRTDERATRGRPLTAGMLGVVRVTYMPRSGDGPVPGRSHRLLPRVGLRLAGGATFVEKVRSR